MSFRLEPYTPNWKTEFEELKQFFSDLLHDIPFAIEHVGSTAIPNMIAKPILDIDIIPGKEEAIPEISKRLERVGYLPKGEQGIPGRFAFRQMNSITPATTTNREWITHHLYVCFANSVALKNHLLFRDALLNEQHLAENYHQLKKQLLNESGMTREVYNKLKTKFILSVLAKRGLTEQELAEIEKANK